MTIINLGDWDLTQEQFEDWITDSGATVSATIYAGGHGRYRYEYSIDDDESMLAFKLKFKPRDTDKDTGFFFCPYVPIIF